MIFTKREEPTSNNDLSHIIYELIRADKDKHFKEDNLRLLDLVRGIASFGGIGSGKTTGSGDNIKREMLSRGYGGTVCVVKPNEIDSWLKIAKEEGRLDDIKIVEPGGKYKINPLALELERHAKEGGGFVDNVVALFMSIIKMGNRMNRGGDFIGREPFWFFSMDRSLKSGFGLTKMAKKAAQMGLGVEESDFEITIPNISKVLRDIPTGPGNLYRFNKLFPSTTFDQHQALQRWANESYVIFCLCWAQRYIIAQQENLGKKLELIKKLEEEGAGELAQINEDYEKSCEELESEQRTFEAIKSYFLSEFPTLAEKTRSSVLEHFYAFANPFRSGLLADYFSTSTSPEILPEETFKGKIILLNFPVLKYGQLGITAQCIYKKIWQQAAERRVVTKNTKPAFLWIDEAHYFVSEDDVLFQTTARESKICTVLISQSISNYYAMLGGDNSKAFVDSLLGNLAVKIFHNNTDTTTNNWASEVIGKDYRDNMTSGDSGVSFSDEYQFKVLPKEFQELKTGGATNDWIVEAIITIADRKFSNGKNFLKVIFKQNLN